jgi:hypothetical protein
MIRDSNFTDRFRIPKETFDTGLADAYTFNAAMERIDELLGGGTGAIEVISGPAGDPAEVIVPNVTKLRFMTEYTPGGHHIAFDAGSGECWIGVTPPPPTLQGQDLAVYPAGITGGLSLSPTSNYKPADPAGSIVSYISRGNSWSVSTPGVCFGFASVGLLIFNLNGVDVATIDLGANFVELNRPTGQNMADYNTAGVGDPIVNGVVTFPGGELQITAVAPAGAPLDAYQKGSATVVINGCLREGWNLLQLRHEVAPLTYSANPWECYEDIDPPGPATNPQMTALDMDLFGLVSKWLSGVNYCGLGTTFEQDMTALRVANNVYHSSSQCIILSSFAGLSTNYPSFAECAVAPFPDVGDIFQYVNRVVTLNVPNAYSEDARLQGNARDPYGTYGPLWTASENILVNTYGTVSTSFWEPCQDENWRLPAGVYAAPPAPWTGNWNSQGDLNVYDATDGLQFRSGGVYYPELNYTVGYVPAAGQPDYTPIWAANLPRRVWRGFRDAGISHSNGVIRLPGITDAMLAASQILIWIKVPTRTGWLRLHGTLYNPVGWTGADNDPCRAVGGSGNDHNFTLATLGTNPASDWGIVVRIEIPNRTSPEITGAWGMVGW